MACPELVEGIHSSVGFMGIDPMADAAGQQGLSPYHAMACNPSILTDPLGLYVKGEAHNGGTPPDYAMEMLMRFPTMPNFMARYLTFGDRTATQSMAEQQLMVITWRAENRIAEMIEGGAMWASGDDVETLYNYLNVKYYNGLKVGDKVGEYTYNGLDQYGRRIYLAPAGYDDEVHVSQSWDPFMNSYLNNIDNEEPPFIKFIGLRKGFIPEFETSLMEGRGAVTPGPFILYGPGLSSDPRYANHEPGHVIQFYLLGPMSYYQFVAIPSIMTSGQSNAMQMPWEKSASALWYSLTGELDPDYE